MLEENEIHWIYQLASGVRENFIHYLPLIHFHWKWKVEYKWNFDPTIFINQMKSVIFICCYLRGKSVHLLSPSSELHIQQRVTSNHRPDNSLSHFRLSVWAGGQWGWCPLWSEVMTRLVTSELPAEAVPSNLRTSPAFVPAQHSFLPHTPGTDTGSAPGESGGQRVTFLPSVLYSPSTAEWQLWYIETFPSWQLHTERSTPTIVTDTF